jgi:hypothetical protein
MAPVSHTAFIDGLRHYNVRYREYNYDGIPWYRHARPRDWTPSGITVHDSVTGGMSAAEAARFCWYGKTGVPGPLYLVLVENDTAHLIGWGPSNNTGMCNAERWRMTRDGKMPLDRELGAPAPDDYGQANSSQYGVALVTAVSATNETEVRTAQRVCAAICRAHGWSPAGGAGSLIGHREITRRKGDPGLTDPVPDMGAFRRGVRDLLTPADITPTDTTTIVPAEEEDVRLTDQLDLNAADAADFNMTEGSFDVNRALRWAAHGAARAARLEEQVAAMQKQLDRIEQALTGSQS